MTSTQAESRLEDSVSVAHRWRGYALEHLGKDESLVRCEVRRQTQARKVRLQEHIRLEVGRVVVGGRELDGDPVVQLAQEDVLVVSDRDVLKLGGGGHNLEETLELGLVRERHGEDVDRHVVDVVVRRDHAQVQRRRVHWEKSARLGSLGARTLVLDRDGLGVLEVRERLLDELRKVVREMSVRCACERSARLAKGPLRTLHVVVVRIRDEATVHPRPARRQRGTSREGRGRTR